MTTSSHRFAHIPDDETAAEFRAEARRLVLAVEEFILKVGNPRGDFGRPISLALTKLEESHMWIGKAIRDRQVYLNGSAAASPSERGK